MHTRWLRLLLQLTIITCFVACAPAPGGGSKGSDTGTEDTGGATGGEGGCAHASAYSAEACNPLCPDESGCVDGQSCTFEGSGFGCIDIPTGEGEAADLWKGCNDSKPCKHGGCVDVPDLGNNKCAPFCKEDADCGAGYSCVLEVSYGGTAPIFMCAPKPAACSVYEQNCEEEGTACYLAGDTGCMEAGEAKKGDDCDTPNACLPGLICVSDRCHEVCNPKTNGPDPKCHLYCQFSGIQGLDDIAICSLPDNEPACTILGDSSDCENGELCYYIPYTGGRCRKPGSGAATSKCDAAEDCKPGLACFPSATSCKPMCDPADGLHDECSSPGVPCSPLPGSNAGFCDQ